MNCQNATGLVSQAQDRKLTLGERIRLRLHLLICRACRRFERQLPMIGRAAKRLAEPVDHSKP
ncbi:MAG: hypothetical protein APF78_01700 [Sphingomonadales bacterium BRH_c3]|nr:MAG: hypothetical protein APF78_01700 [Sphingomonadales bacterium BRH_c3]